MKKLLFLVAVSAMLNVSAESDQYLYWMVGDEATVDDGTTLTQGKNYQAMIKDAGGSYLNLYANPVSSSTYGQIFTFELGESMDTFAKLVGPASSFVVELYNYGTESAVGSWIGQATLSWNNGNITTGGMGHATSASAVSFTAVPEPTSGMLLLIGVAGLALRRKNKKA